MKTILKTITIILLTITLCNCSKDDDNNSNQNEAQTTQQLLIGKWYYSITPDGIASACVTQSYYHFTDTQNLDYKYVIDDTGGIAPSGYQLIGDCYFSNDTPVNYTLNEDNAIQFPLQFGETKTLKIVSINETKLVLTQGSLENTTIYILTKDL